jgi:hypothetical protein
VEFEVRGLAQKPTKVSYQELIVLKALLQFRREIVQLSKK